MYKKPVLSAGAAPWLPPPEDGVMGRRWKQDFEEGVIHPFLPQRKRRGIRAEALDTARDVKTHPYSSFTIMHLTPLKGISEGDFYTFFDFAMSAAFRNWPRFIFFMSLLLLLNSHRMATKAGIIRCFVLKKYASFWLSCILALLRMETHSFAPVTEVEQDRCLESLLRLVLELH